MKVCCGCGQTTEEFYKDKRASDGLFSRCIPCYRSYYKENRERVLESNKIWNQSNRDKRKVHDEKQRRKDRVVRREREAARRCRYKIGENFKEENLVFYELARECEMLTGDKYHVDHILPLRGKNVSGLHVPWNLQVLPADVNIRKSNRVGG